MDRDLKVAIIGLDTSHAIEFPKRMQDPQCPAEQKVAGLKAVSCLRFSTPFQNEEGLNKRQQQLEGWGVKVTTDFGEAVADCDVLMLEINDPAFHREYFFRCAELGKPIFLDKPMADNIANGKAIFELARIKRLPVFSASSLRFVPQLQAACAAVPNPLFVNTFGPLGQAPAGSGIVWYGVHAFEMLERAMGRGARSVFVKKDGAGITAIVAYPDNRRGLVELTNEASGYGGCVRAKGKAAPFIADMKLAYTDLLREIERFFRSGQTPVALEDTLEIMALLDAARRSNDSGKEEGIIC